MRVCGRRAMSSEATAGPTVMPPPRRDPLVCDVTGVCACGETLDALARFELAVRRIGCELVVRNAAPELVELVAFAGLAEALRLEPRREPEEREERVGVEEERQLADPAA